MFKNKISKFIQIFLLSLVLFNPSAVIAQTKSSTVNNIPKYSGVQDSISNYLCAPSDSGDDSHALEKCVNKLYRFGIAFGAIALVFFLVFAGYMYMIGGETGKQKGKSIFQNALVGMGLLLGSYLILSFINPSLVLYKPIQPPIFTAADLPSCQDVGLNQDCVLPNGGMASGNGSGGGSAYADCPGATLVAVSKISTDGSVGQVCATLLAKLVQLKATTPKIPWMVSSTVDGKHLSNCHKPGYSVTGVCADLALSNGRSPSYSKEAGSTNPQWNDLCKAVKALGGIAIANEASKAPECPGYKAYTTTTGPNLHIFLSK